MGACTGAARRCVHFPPVLQGLHRAIPQADAWPIPHLLETPINLLQPRGKWSAHWPPPLTTLLAERNLVNRISIRKTSHMSIQPQLTLMDYAGNKPHLSLSNRLLDTKSDQR